MSEKFLISSKICSEIWSLVEQMYRWLFSSSSRTYERDKALDDIMLLIHWCSCLSLSSVMLNDDDDWSLLAWVWFWGLFWSHTYPEVFNKYPGIGKLWSERFILSSFINILQTWWYHDSAVGPTCIFAMSSVDKIDAERRNIETNSLRNLLRANK